MFTLPGWLLRLEEASLLIVAVTLYAHLHFSWLLFAALFFVPDVSMLGYLANPRLGAAIYSFGHALFLALALLAFGYLGEHPLAIAIALVWVSHITFDRALGYGSSIRPLSRKPTCSIGVMSALLRGFGAEPAEAVGP